MKSDVEDGIIIRFEGPEPSRAMYEVAFAPDKEGYSINKLVLGAIENISSDMLSAPPEF